MFDEKRIIIPEIDPPPRFPRTPIPDKSFGDGLIVRSPNWLGDAVMTLPALKQLRTILPAHAGLFVACPVGLVPLFRALPIVDVVQPLNDPHAFPNRRERILIRSLHAGAGVLFNNSFRDALALRLLGVKLLYGAKARNRSWLLKTSWPFEKRRDFVLNHPHQASKYLAMADALGAAEWDGTMPEMTPHAVPARRTDNFFTLLENPEILALAPGAAYGDAKRWAPEHFRAVASAWLERFPGGIVIALGGKAEKAGADEAVAGLDRDRAFNFAGQTNLDELMVLLARAKMCLANDSGAMHLAAALGTPGVAIFGSTDPAATAPVSKKWRILYEKQSCSPCFKRDCPFGTKACFAPLSPADAVACMEQLLS